MRTIIPFPQIHGVVPTQPSKNRLSKLIVRFSVPGSALARPAGDVPEGESMSAAIAQMPKARALNQGINGLIAAVRGRFG